MENSSIEYAGDIINNSNWHPEFSSLSNIMVLPISDEDIIYTFDQFQSISRQKVRSWDGHLVPGLYYYAFSIIVDPA